MFNENKKTLKKLKYVFLSLSACLFSLEVYAKYEFDEGSNFITHRAPIPAKKSQRTWNQMDDDKKAQNQTIKERPSKFFSIDEEKKYNAAQEEYLKGSKTQGHLLAKSLKSDVKVALPNNVPQGEDAKLQRTMPVKSSLFLPSLTSSGESDADSQSLHQKLAASRGGIAGLSDAAKVFRDNAKIEASRQVSKKKSRRSWDTERPSKDSSTESREPQRRVPVGSSFNPSSLTSSGESDAGSQSLHQKPAASRGGTAGLSDAAEGFAENAKIEASRQMSKKRAKTLKTPAPDSMHQESKKPQRQRATEQSSKASFTKGREHFVLVQNRMADKYGTPQYIIGSRKAYPGPTLPEKTIELLEAASEASESAKASYQETNDFGVLVVDMWSGFAKALFPKQEKLIDRGAEIGRDYYSNQDKK